MKKILLDTNSYSFLSEGNKIIRKLTLEADLVYISVITLGELYRGFMAGIKERQNMLLLEEFLSEPHVQIAKIGKATAEIYGELSYAIRKQGMPLPTNDVWIAASSIETDSTIITYDRHFLGMPQVKVWDKLR